MSRPGSPMASWLLLVGLGLLGGAGCASADYDDTRPARGGQQVVDTVEEIARHSTLRVRAVACGAQGLSSGSAFAISETTLITNRHVAENSQLLEVSTWDGRDYEVEVASVAYLDDLALLTLSEPVSDYVEIGESAYSGQKVYAVGYPRGGQWTLTEGAVHDVVAGSRYDEPGNVIRMTAGIEPGNSGGPLLDERGRLIGVVFAVDLQEGFGLAIETDRLRTLSQETLPVGSRESC